MMALLSLLVLVFLAKIVFIDSPVGQALGDAIRSRTAEKAPPGTASRAELESLRGEIYELRERIERVVEEQAFLTRLLTEPKGLGSGPDDSEDGDT